MLASAPQIRFVTAKDGYRFTTRLWHVENPTAHVICVHGIVSHGGWYLSSCAHLAREGFGVHLLDRRGSGLNLQNRGDVDCWQTWLADVEDYLESLPNEIPRILLGISWGGTLAAAVARHRPDLLHGIGLLCPGLFSRKAANLVQRAILRVLRRTGFRRFHVTIPLQDPAFFTASPSAQQYIATDSLNLWKITIAFASENIRLIQYATGKPEEIRTPTLTMLAELDSIVMNSKVREFVDRIDHPNKHIIEYADASHSLEFEPDPSQYFRDLAAWCTEVAQAEKR